jgi:hypothetical protein
MVTENVGVDSMKYTDIFVASPPQNIQNMLQYVFYQNKFNVQWHSHSAGKAQRGSKGANIALGALSQYYEIDFEILVMPDQSFAVRLFKSNSGWWGGAIGAMKVSKQYDTVVDLLSNYFMTQGCFKGRSCV